MVKRLLFFMDATSVYEDVEGNYYFHGSLSNGMIKRYLDLCENLVLICRKNKEIYSVDEAKRSFQRIESPKVEVKCIINPRSNLKCFLGRSTYAHNEKIVQEEISRADAVIVRFANCVSSSFLISCFKKYKKKYMLECVGDSFAAMWYYNLFGKILSFHEEKRVKEFAKNANAVMYVTESFLQKKYPTAAPTIGISDVDIPKVKEDVINKRIQRIHNMSKPLIIGTIGAVDVKYKGQEYVIKALGYLKSKGFNEFKYQIVGGGDSSRLESVAREMKVQEHVEFIGGLSHEHVLEWLDSIDVYVQPSLLEGMPRALIEAMSRGVPSFASNVGGVPELLDEEMLFRKGSVKGIVKLLKELNRAKMEEEAKRNFLFAKKFEYEKLDSERSKFYNQFCALCAKERWREWE